MKTTKQKTCGLYGKPGVFSNFLISGLKSMAVLTLFIIAITGEADTKKIIDKINKQALIAHKSQSSPKLDGVLDDECWKPNACQRTFTVFGATSPSKFPMTVKVAYDNNNLYFAFRCNEKAEYLKQNYKKDDDALWFDSSIEIFLTPQRSSVIRFLDKKERHFHFIFNPAGARFDQLGMQGGDSWNGKWEVKTKIFPDYWVSEVKIPFTVLKAKKQAKTNAPPNMDIWAIQIGKTSYGKDKSELSSLFPAKGFFREHSNFGLMLLLENPKAQGIGYYHDHLDYVEPQLKKIDKALQSVPKNLAIKITRKKERFLYRWRRAPGITYILRRKKLLQEVKQLQHELNKLQKQLLTSNLKKAGRKALLVPHPAISDSKKIIPEFIPLFSDSKKTVKISLCRSEFEPASVVLWAPKQLENIKVLIKPVDGVSITAHWVKCWYQSGTAIVRGNRTLTPELLLNNDNIFEVDMTKQVNIFKEPVALPRDWKDTYPQDSDTLQPLNVLPAQFAKQIWLTAHASNDAASGMRQSKITVLSDGKIIAELPLKIEVLDFKLLPSKLTHGCYGNTFWGRKSVVKAKNEMRDYLNHGVTTVGLREKAEHLPKVIKMMREIGLNTETTYLTNCVIPVVIPHSGIIQESVIKTRINIWMNAARKSKIENLYIYLIDEVKGKDIKKIKSFASLIHQAGAKTWCAFNIGPSYRKSVGDSVDAVVYAGKPNRSVADAAHRDDNRIFSYANPQCGLELPETYRRNFGLLLWQMNFDGAFNFAWTWLFNYRKKPSHPWDDFDSPHYRDHCMVYPTKTSVVSTIQSEGWREGVDDCRYLTTLEYWIERAKDGGKSKVAETASSWLTKIKDGGSTATKDLDGVRSKMIKHIQACRRSLQK